MKKPVKKEVYEQYEKLKMEIADGYSQKIGEMIRLLQDNNLGNVDYWVDKYCNFFFKELYEKKWDFAYGMIFNSFDSSFDDSGVFFNTGNEEKLKELRDKYVEALENELNGGNRAVRKRLNKVYCSLGKTDKAILLWQSLAESGNPIAQFELARIYEYLVKDKNTAFIWYKKAADGEHDTALNVLPTMERSLNEKKICVGSFWGIPDKVTGKQVIAGMGEILNGNEKLKGEMQPYYFHLHVYKYPLSPHKQALRDTLLSGDETFDLYPKFSVCYDADNDKHIFYIDECIKQECIDEAVSEMEIENYEVRHDNEYVCPNCRHKYPAVELKYNILRGQDKIGENLIEISYGRTKILVELGKSLDDCDEAFEQEILNKKYSAVIVSHYHEDHAGLIKYKTDCPVYMGRGAYRIINAKGNYHGEGTPQNFETYCNGKPFSVGNIKVTPFLCDHSAYDSYMLLFEAGGKSILYTGDFRFHGRKDKDKLLFALPKNVGVLIHEGTNIGKNSCTITESELEEKAVDIMQGTQNPVFVLQSGSNIDRLVSVYRASKRSGRITYMDNYTSLIASAAGGSIPRPDIFRDVIAFTPRPVYGKREEMFMEIFNKRGLKGIANGTKRFTMLVRQSMTDYLKKLISEAHIEGATLIYSMWKGYKDNEDTAAFLNEMKALGVNIVDLHTSGHASAEDIELLKQTVNAKQTVCVHTETAV